MIHQRHFAGVQLLGARRNQQDSFGFFQPEPGLESPVRLLAVLADGMGGEAGGEEASQLAVDIFLQIFESATGTSAERLAAALDAVNREMALAVGERPELTGMGCTLLAVVIEGEEVSWLSVGDSLLYRFRGKESERLNADHSLGAHLDARAQRGEITPEQARETMGRHQLMSAVTGDPLTLVDLARQPLLPGDRFVLASDGVLTLTVDELAAVVRGRGGAVRLAERVVKRVARKKASHQDNTTVLALLPGPEEPGWWRRLGVVLSRSGQARE